MDLKLFLFVDLLGDRTKLHSLLIERFCQLFFLGCHIPQGIDFVRSFLSRKKRTCRFKAPFGILKLFTGLLAQLVRFHK